MLRNLSKFLFIPGIICQAQIKARCENNLRLHIGSCYIPHPGKRFRGGEDAHLSCNNTMVVSDGVSAWYEEEEIDAGIFALKLVDLIAQSILQDLKDVITEAHDKISEERIEGSATVCMARLKENHLEVCNLGDCQLHVYRPTHSSSWTLFHRVAPGETVYKRIFCTKPMKHDSDRPFQIGSHESADPPSVSQTYRFALQKGDVVVLGSDGLWDVLSGMEHILDSIDSIEPTKMAWEIGTLAYQSSERLGKFDDITVLVANVE